MAQLALITTQTLHKNKAFPNDPPPGVPGVVRGRQPSEGSTPAVAPTPMAAPEASGSGSAAVADDEEEWTKEDSDLDRVS